MQVRSIQGMGPLFVRTVCLYPEFRLGLSRVRPYIRFDSNRFLATMQSVRISFSFCLVLSFRDKLLGTGNTWRINWKTGIVSNEYRYKCCIKDDSKICIRLSNDARIWDTKLNICNSLLLFFSQRNITRKRICPPKNSIFIFDRQYCCSDELNKFTRNKQQTQTFWRKKILFFKEKKKIIDTARFTMFKLYSYFRHGRTMKRSNIECLSIPCM